MKIVLLYILKWLGGFFITKFLIRKKTLILTYHSFEIVNETKFRPKLFIKKSTFEQRLQYLKKHCNVIKLDDLSSKNKPNNSIVITIDDGWASILTVASPLLIHFNYPYSIYLTTEGVLAEQPTFHILLDYMLRSSINQKLSLSAVDHKPVEFIIKEENVPFIIQEVNRIKSKKYDTDLLKKMAFSLNFPIDKLINEKIFTLLSVTEIKQLVELGADIQLHTHSHHNYIDDELTFNSEIKVNQLHIENITGVKPVHHCYPSGKFNSACFGYLQALGIETATTCKPGFCDDESNRFELPRFLDGENIPKIVFEAEVCGVLEIFRKLKYKFINH